MDRHSHPQAGPLRQSGRASLGGSECVDTITARDHGSTEDRLKSKEILHQPIGRCDKEAIVLGIPDMERYLIKKGLPLRFARDASQATSTALRILKHADAFRMDTRGILDELESPIKLITQIVTG